MQDASPYHVPALSTGRFEYRTFSNMLCAGYVNGIANAVCNQHSFFLRLLLLVCTFIITGCYKPVKEPVIISSQLQTPPARIQRYTAGMSAEKRPLECVVLGQGSDVCFILATIHGDEPSGTPLVNHLIDYLQDNPDLLTGRKVVIMPVANPDGMYHNSRRNVHDVDLNRNFAAANRFNKKAYGYTACSQPEARVVAELISRYQPDRIVSIHQPLNCIDYDGPGRELAYRMADYCNIPVRKLGARPGSLGSYAGEGLGIPIITLELPGPKGRMLADRQTLWRRYGQTLLAAIIYPERPAK